VEEVYNLVFSPCTIFYRYGVSLTSPSMNFALPLNQMLALVSRGLCNSQAVTVFFWTVYLWLQTLVSCGGKICSIFKVLGMRRKRCHCVRLVLLIPAVYLFSQTESVWRSYRDLFAEPNRKKNDADWAGRTATWQGRTVLTWRPYNRRGRQMTCRVVIGRLVDELCGDTWHIVGKLKGATWPNEGLPRGTPILAIGSFIKSFWRPRGSTPRPPIHSKF
jgi:hypothetical protein